MNTRSKTPHRSEEIDTILFDLGHVLVKDGHWRVYQSLGIEYGSRQHELWQLHKVGKIGEMEFWRQTLERTSYQGQEEAIAQRVREAYQNARPEAAYTMVKPLHSSGYRLAILSNHAVAWAGQVVKNLGLELYCNPILISEEIRMAKPEKECFEYALERLDRLAVPNRVLFVDDKAENVEAFARLGGKGIVYNGIESLEKGLKTHGVMRLHPKINGKRAAPSKS